MNCPKCHVCNTKVLESRPSAYGTRRRRECLRGHRFTTYEMIGDQDDARDRAIVAIGPELDALQDAIDRLRHKRVGGSNVVTWG